MGCVTCYPVYNTHVNPQCGKNKVHTLSLPLFENRRIIEQPVDLTTRYVESAKHMGAVYKGRPANGEGGGWF